MMKFQGMQYQGPQRFEDVAFLEPIVFEYLLAGAWTAGFIDWLMTPAIILLSETFRVSGLVSVGCLNTTLADEGQGSEGAWVETQKHNDSGPLAKHSMHERPLVQAHLQKI